MNARIIAVLVAIPMLLTTVAVARTVSNRGGGRDPIVLSDREVTIGRRGSETSGLRLWINWSDRRAVPRQAPLRRGVRRRTYVALYLDPTIVEGSRLVAIDRHDDPDVLARRYPAGRTHIITAATVTADGQLQRIDPSGVVVPRELGDRLPVASVQSPVRVYEPYRFTLRYGRHREPFLVDIERR